MNNTSQKIKVTVAFDPDLHAAATEMAHTHHRSFVGEVNFALERHVKNANIEEGEQV